MVKVHCLVFTVNMININLTSKKRISAVRSTEYLSEFTSSLWYPVFCLSVFTLIIPSCWSTMLDKIDFTKRTKDPPCSIMPPLKVNNLSRVRLVSVAKLGLAVKRIINKGVLSQEGGWGDI